MGFAELALVCPTFKIYHKYPSHFPKIEKWVFQIPEQDWYLVRDRAVGGFKGFSQNLKYTAPLVDFFVYIIYIISYYIIYLSILS